MFRCFASTAGSATGGFFGGIASTILSEVRNALDSSGSALSPEQILAAAAAAGAASGATAALTAASGCGGSKRPPKAKRRGGKKDPCKGLRKQVAAHKKKLDDYVDDPLRHDNLNALTSNPAFRHLGIIVGRIDSLLGQIGNFERLLDKCEKASGQK